MSGAMFNFLDHDKSSYIEKEERKAEMSQLATFFYLNFQNEFDTMITNAFSELDQDDDDKFSLKEFTSSKLYITLLFDKLFYYEYE